MAGNYGKWQYDMGFKLKWKIVNEILLWYEYMEMDNHTLQGTVASNRIQPFLMVMVQMKNDKWQGTMASGSKIWDVIRKVIK